MVPDASAQQGRTFLRDFNLHMQPESERNISNIFEILWLEDEAIETQFSSLGPFVSHQTFSCNIVLPLTSA